jgi:2-oxoglutarate ferredoxin oxidoreductase subunit gamma
METSIVIAGFGGQGVLFAGKLLAYTGMDHGYNVTWIPSYGPEMRGGTANCTVIISDSPIGAPIVARPDVVLALNLPSYEKYEPLVKPQGALVVNSAIVEAKSTRKDISAVYVPANLIAEELDAVKMLNMIMVGAMLAARPVLPFDAVAATLVKELGTAKKHLVEINLKVLRRGYDSVTMVAT